MSDKIFKALDDSLKAVTKKSSKDNPFKGLALHKAGDLSIDSYVPYGIPTGIPELDIRIRGGYPAGKVIELYGFQFCGKTTAALHAAAQTHKMGGIVIWIDTERAWDDDRARDLDLNIDKTYVFSADTIEAIIAGMTLSLDQLEEAAHGVPTLIVVDSITGVPTENEDATYLSAEARVGQEAKQIRRGVKTLVKKFAGTKATVIFINHAIAKIAAYGRQSQAAGGHAIKLFATVRVGFTAKSQIKDASKERRLGQVIQMECEKLRGTLMSPIISSLQLLDNVGFDANTSLLNAAEETGFIKKKTSKTYVIGDQEFLRQNWEEVIERNGGYEGLYNAWRQDAIDKGVLLPWGVSKYGTHDVD